MALCKNIKANGLNEIKKQIKLRMEQYNGIEL